MISATMPECIDCGVELTTMISRSDRLCSSCNAARRDRIKQDAFLAPLEDEKGRIARTFVEALIRQCETDPHDTLGSIAVELAVMARRLGVDPPKIADSTDRDDYQLPDGTWRILRFCDEPNTGLCVLEAVEPTRAINVVAPVAWVEGYRDAQTDNVRLRDLLVELLETGRLGSKRAESMVRAALGMDP